MTFDNALLYIVHTAIFCLAGYAGYRALRDANLRGMYGLALSFKVICGLLLGLLYSLHYGGGDTLDYYTEAVRKVDLPWKDFYSWSQRSPGYDEPQRAIFFTKIVAWVKYLFQTDYWLSSVYFSLFSFFCSFYLVRKVALFFPRLLVPVSISFLFVPSIVFWSSGLIKESIAFGGMCLILGGYLQIREESKIAWHDLVLVVIGGLVILELKYYVAAVLFPLIGSLLLIRVIRKHWPDMQWYYWGLGTTVLVFGLVKVLALIHPNLELSRVLWAIDQSRAAIIEYSSEENLIAFSPGNDSFGSALANLFTALYSGLLRPFVYESLSFPKIFSGIENLIVLALLIARFRNLRPFKNFKLETVFALIYILLLSILLTYSIPNLGTLARLKIYYMPFLWTMLWVGQPILEWKLFESLTLKNR